MRTIQNDIRKFMLLARQEIPERPTQMDYDTRVLRIKLIAEELIELTHALGMSLILNSETGQIGIVGSGKAPDLIETADAIIDLIYVVAGAGLATGFDLEPLWNEVQRSNMTKFIDGHRRGDGKWVNGPSYTPANLAPIIEAQIVSTEKL